MGEKEGLHKEKEIKEISYMKYVAYKGTPYEKKVIIPEKKKFGSQSYELADVFDNYGRHQFHETAIRFAEHVRYYRGNNARVVASSGFTAVYAGNKKKK